MIEYKLDTVVREFLVEIGDQSEHKYFRCLQIALSGLRELSFDISGVPKHVTLPVNANLTCDLPDDYINYTRIALCYNGNMVDMGLNNNMCLPSANECGNLQSGSNTVGITDAIYAGVAADHSRNGEMTGRYFGLGGGNNRFGYYRIDKENGLIVLSQTSATEVELEYISDIKRVNGSTVVHPFITNCLKGWIWWKWIQRDRNYSLGEKQLAEREYKTELLLSLRRLRSSTWAEWLQTIRTSTQSTAKF